MQFNKSILIDKKVISENSPVFIIAEIGVNHNGSFELAKKMIDEAAKTNVNAVKFQSFYPEDLVVDNAPKADYQLQTTDSNESQFEMLQKLVIPKNQMEELKKYTESKGLIFLSTPFDEKSLYDLEAMNVCAYKISSTDTTNLLFLKKVARLNKPIILSTGMSSTLEIKQALEVIASENNRDVILLHCTSNYPTSYNEVNMLAINSLKEDFNTIVGYSDHTEGVGIAPYTIPIGVKVIEKHFTLDKKMTGPDHLASLNIEELSKLVREIRRIELSLGSGIKEPTETEVLTKEKMQKKLVASEDIKMGMILTEENITAKRAQLGIPANHVFEYIGKKVSVNIPKNKILDESDFYGEGK